MPEDLVPGVYVEEIERDPRPIEGAPTSISAFLGDTERGAIAPRLVTSYEDFRRWFGGAFGTDQFLPDAVNGYFENGGKRLYVSRLVGKQATTARATFDNFTVMAVGPGSWGRRIWARIDDSSTTAPDAAGAGQPVGFRLRLAYWTEVPPAGPYDPFQDDDATRLALLRHPPTLQEDFDDLVVDPGSPNYFETRLVDSAGFGNSALAIMARNPDAAATELTQQISQALAQDGTDDPNPLDVADYEGNPSGAARTQLQGLAALETEPYREVSLVYAPAAAVDVIRKVIAHCERMRFRFAVADCARASSTGGLDPRSAIQDTPYAAFYCPWVYVSDPQSGARRLVPPGGHILGIYARVDSERGVFKAPANEIVRGVLALEADITDATQGVLNPRGVNAIRSFPGRGIRVWGARTLSSDALWKYVSVRRLITFLERSIHEGTQWVVFEPNDPRLWARVTDTIRLFLRGQWRLGALSGRTEEQAFFVACDATTMTQDDILNGRLICEIGIAPVRPAEFVIFRIFQHTAQAQR